MISKESKNISRVRRHARVRSKISGTPECPRLCVYRSNKNIELKLRQKSALISLRKLKQRKSQRFSLIDPDIFTTDVSKHLQKPLEKLA